MTAFLLLLLSVAAPADSLAAHGRWFYDHRHLDAAWLDSAAALAARARALDRFGPAPVALACDARLALGVRAAARRDKLAFFDGV